RPRGVAAGAGMAPAPEAAIARGTKARAMVAADSAIERVRGAQRSGTEGAVWGAQPSGEAHERPLPPTSTISPIARNKNVAPRTAPAMPAAERENSLICTVIAVIPANTIPVSPVAKPTRIDPIIE